MSTLIATWSTNDVCIGPPRMDTSALAATWVPGARAFAAAASSMTTQRTRPNVLFAHFQPHLPMPCLSPPAPYTSYPLPLLSKHTRHLHACRMGGERCPYWAYTGRWQQNTVIKPPSPLSFHCMQEWPVMNSVADLRANRYLTRKAEGVGQVGALIPRAFKGGI